MLLHGSGNLVNQTKAAQCVADERSVASMYPKQTNACNIKKPQRVRLLKENCGGLTIHAG